MTLLSKQQELRKQITGLVGRAASMYHAKITTAVHSSDASITQEAAEVVEKAVDQLLALVEEQTRLARLDTIARIKTNEHWEMCETCMDCTGSLAVKAELDRLQNTKQIGAK